MLIDEVYIRNVIATRPDLLEKFSKKLENKYGSHANVIQQDHERFEKLFRHWLVTSEIL